MKEKRNFSLIDEKIRRKEEEIQSLKEKRDMEILKEIYTIISKKNITMAQAINVLREYDFSENNIEGTLNQPNENPDSFVLGTSGGGKAFYADEVKDEI